MEAAESARSSDMLTLGELEEGLLAVDDLEGAEGQQLPDVPRVEPAVLVQHLVRLPLLLQSHTISLIRIPYL